MTDIEDIFLWKKFYEHDAKIDKNGCLQFIVNHSTGEKLYPFYKNKNVSGIVKFSTFRTGYKIGSYELRSIY